MALRFHVPEPSARPGDEPDFSYLDIPAAGAVRRPEVDVDAAEIRDLASTLVRVLDDEHRAVGPWTPEIDAEALRRGLRGMVTTRHLRRADADRPAPGQVVVLHGLQG